MFCTLWRGHLTGTARSLKNARSSNQDSAVPQYPQRHRHLLRSALFDVIAYLPPNNEQP
jgi:hypothetical protein